MKSPAVAFCATLALLLAACRTASAQSEGLVPTYGARGFNPWSVAAEPPVRNEPVVIIGAPLMSGTATSFLRLAVCRVEVRTPVVLEYIWHWFDFHGNRCADIRRPSAIAAISAVMVLRGASSIGRSSTIRCPRWKAATFSVSSAEWSQRWYPPVHEI
jgi:hypothetical protein